MSLHMLVRRFLHRSSLLTECAADNFGILVVYIQLSRRVLNLGAVLDHGNELLTHLVRHFHVAASSGCL